MFLKIMQIEKKDSSFKIQLLKEMKKGSEEIKVEEKRACLLKAVAGSDAKLVKYWLDEG